MHPNLRKAFPRHWLDPLVGALARTGMTPNAITWLGFVLSAGAGALAAVGALPLAGWLSLLAGSLDMLDGALARATNRASRFGALLDSTLDRFSEAVIFLGLFIYFIGQDQQQELILIYATVVGSLMVSYARARAEGIGVPLKDGLFTRFERVFLLVIHLIMPKYKPAKV